MTLLAAFTPGLVFSCTDPEVKVASVKIDREDAELCVGGTLHLKASVLLDGATDKAVTWESSNASVATVDSDGAVTAVLAGTAIITVTADDKSASCAVTVSYAALAFESGEPFAISLDTSAFSGSGVSMAGKLEWSTDYSEWTQLEAGGEAKSGGASGRHVLFLRGEGNTGIYGTIAITPSREGGKVSCLGDIMMLLDWQNPDKATVGYCCFYGLFMDDDSPVSAPSLSAVEDFRWLLLPDVQGLHIT